MYLDNSLKNFDLEFFYWLDLGTHRDLKHAHMIHRLLKASIDYCFLLLCGKSFKEVLLLHYLVEADSQAILHEVALRHLIVVALLLNCQHDLAQQNAETLQ